LDILKRGGDRMTIERLLIMEVVSFIKWLAIGGLLIMFAFYHVNKIEYKRSLCVSRAVRLFAKLLEDKSRNFVDYLLREVEEKKSEE